MIGVKKIAHATYETPNLDQQIEYYTDILGLGLIAREKDTAYLASTIDHHSVVLLKGGGDSARCVRIGFQLGIDDDIDAFEKQTAAHGIKTVRKKDPEPSIAEMVSFEDPKGTTVTGRNGQRSGHQTPMRRTIGAPEHRRKCASRKTRRRR